MGYQSWAFSEDRILELEPSKFYNKNHCWGDFSVLLLRVFVTVLENRRGISFGADQF